MTDYPYAGTSGWSGSETSRERAEREDADGTTSKRQRRALRWLDVSQARGMTWKDMAIRNGWHHGQASGVLSVLHKAGKIERLTERRDRCQVYVLPEYVNDRETVPHGRIKHREVAVIDAEHLHRQRRWSTQAFGPSKRTLGIIDHISKELKEIEADPTDVEEWVDVIILALDGAWRAGWEPQDIIDAIVAKQAKNEARTWPDWRKASEDKAIEHDRTGERPRSGICPSCRGEEPYHKPDCSRRGRILGGLR